MKKLYPKIAIGIFSIFFGVLIYLKEDPYLHGFPIPRYSGVLMVVFGLIWIGYFLVYEK